MIGDRPCADIDRNKVESLKNIIVPIIEKVIGQKLRFETASTDCNVPYSVGVPALAVGLSTHGGVHTYEEWVDKKSMILGLEIALKLGFAFV